MLVHGHPRDHQKLVAAENQKKPLSDSKIAGLLEAQGIQVARRTVAKYRESSGSRLRANASG